MQCELFVSIIQKQLVKAYPFDSEWQSNDYDYITDVNNVQNRTWHIEYTSNSRFNCNAKFVQKAILFN